MRNTILTVVITMLLPVTASAQFYTITRETEINPASVRKTVLDAVYKQETAEQRKRQEMMPFSLLRQFQTTVVHPTGKVTKGCPQ